VAELVYEVSFKGIAGESLRAAFDDCDVRADHEMTIVRCRPGLLAAVFERIQSLGLEMLDTRLIAEPGPDDCS
jgi:hypothetical protein